MARPPRSTGIVGHGQGFADLAATLDAPLSASRWEGELTSMRGRVGDVEIRLAVHLSWSLDVIEGYGRMLELDGGQISRSGNVLVSGTASGDEILDLQIWVGTVDLADELIIGQGHVSADGGTLCGEWSTTPRVMLGCAMDTTGGIFQLRRVD